MLKMVRQEQAWYIVCRWKNLGGSHRWFWNESLNKWSPTKEGGTRFPVKVEAQRRMLRRGPSGAAQGAAATIFLLEGDRP